MIVALTGPNEYELFANLRQSITKFVAAHGDLAVERVDGMRAELSELTGALESLPFLATRKLVVLDRPSNVAGFAERAEKLLDGVADNIDVVIVEPTLDKRTSYAKLLKRVTDYREYIALDEVALVTWLTRYAREQGGRLSPADAKYLMQRVGPRQGALAHEVDKLIMHDPSVTVASIDVLTEPEPQSSVFALMEAAFRGDSANALRLYDEQRAQSVEPAMIIALLAQQLHMFSLAKTMPSGASAQSVATQASVHPYAMKKAAEVARRLSIGQIRSYITELRELDRLTKTTQVSADDALRTYIISLGVQQRADGV